MNFEDFAARLRAQGFDEVVEVSWPPRETASAVACGTIACDAVAP